MKNIDYKLFIVVVLLIVFGAIMISSVSVYSSYKVTYEQYLSYSYKFTYYVICNKSKL